MPKQFSLAYKQKMIERLTGAGAVSANQLSQETGVSQGALSLWLREARTMHDVARRNRGAKAWTIDEKVRVLAAASKVAGTELTAMLQREGLQLAEFEEWRLALGENTVSYATTRRIRVLERELARKDKALAEAAALLILKKKLDHYWEGEGDGTDEATEK